MAIEKPADKLVYIIVNLIIEAFHLGFFLVLLTDFVAALLRGLEYLFKKYA